MSATDEGGQFDTFTADDLELLRRLEAAVGLTS